MATNDAVISDIHIGDNSRTCWYQQSVHEPYLLALFDWVIAGSKQPAGDRIDRLVILGDLFDFWTYPPDRQPPTTQQILDANPNIFGPGGKLSQVMDALGGNVIYLHGNHDMNISQADLDLIPTGSKKIQLVDDIVVSHDSLLYTHGHLFTMFNAPDDRYPGEVPIGHFVTRAVSYYVDSILKPGETAADLHDQGSPYGFQLSSFIPAIWKFLSDASVTNMLIDYMSQRTGLSLDQPITMADGSTSTLAVAKAKYDGLFAHWAMRNPGPIYGPLVAGKAAYADYDGSYMAWFAQREATRNGVQSVVVGHTHQPKAGIENSWTRYYNSGFECPSTPDLAAAKPTHFNFTLTRSDGNIQLFQVAKQGSSYSIQKAGAPQDQIHYPPTLDYSCYVRIHNTSSSDLIRQSFSVGQGVAVAEPPNVIPAGGVGHFWLQDLPITPVDPVPHGSDGTATYAHADGTGKMTFTVDCPTGFYPNVATGGAYFLASTGTQPSKTTPRNSVPRTGYPLFVEFFT